MGQSTDEPRYLAAPKIRNSDDAPAGVQPTGFYHLHLGRLVEELPHKAVRELAGLNSSPALQQEARILIDSQLMMSHWPGASGVLPAMKPLPGEWHNPMDRYKSDPEIPDQLRPEVPVTPEMIEALDGLDWGVRRARNERCVEVYRAMHAVAPDDWASDFVKSAVFQGQKERIATAEAERDEARDHLRAVISHEEAPSEYWESWRRRCLDREDAGFPSPPIEQQIKALTAERDGTRAELAELTAGIDYANRHHIRFRDQAFAQLAAKDARIAELDSELAKATSALKGSGWTLASGAAAWKPPLGPRSTFADPEPEAPELNPFREFGGDRRRVGG